MHSAQPQILGTTALGSVSATYDSECVRHKQEVTEVLNACNPAVPTAPADAQVLVLNKSHMVARSVLEGWLGTFNADLPSIPFSSTGMQPPLARRPPRAHATLGGEWEQGEASFQGRHW